jgi:hypothetical protein
MASVIREPLVYFLLLAALIFVSFEQVFDQGFSSSSSLEEIVVTEGQIKSLVLGFEKVWQRSPSAEELKGVIDGYIREEVFYREALAMGLDRNDGVVRRRMSQKIQFLSEDLVSLDDPQEQELQAYLKANADDYRLPSRFTFRQVYVNTSERGQSAQTDAIALLEKLQQRDADAESLSDPLMIAYQFDAETDREIERTLGRTFLESLIKLPTGSWQGPIMSGYGLHLVRVDERVAGKAPELADVRDAVLRDWTSIKQKQANESLYQSLRSKYEVNIEDGLKLNTAQLSMLGTAR